MKSVAIYGFAPQTRDLIKHSDADEVWTLNNFYNYGLDEERVSRTFEMHHLWIASAYATDERQNAGAQTYWSWLKRKHPFKMYMPKLLPDFKREFAEIKALDLENLSLSELDTWGVKLKEIEIAFGFFGDCEADLVRYPLEDVINDSIPLIPGIDTKIFPERGMLPYYVSSIDYMTALAIYERFDRIEYYGVELAEKTEWAMQKTGATFWAGFARGRGIEVLIPRKSVLMTAPLYGIDDGGQMIPVQVPEELKRQLTLEMDRNRNLHNHYSGKFTVLQENHRGLIEAGDDEGAAAIMEKINATQKDADESMTKMYLAEGGMNAMNYLINHEDLKLEPIRLESITRMEIIETKLDEVKGTEDE